MKIIFFLLFVITILIPNFSTADSLIGYWDLNEGSGTVTADSSSYNRQGTLLNMDNSDWVTGIKGNALEFDGVNDAVEISPIDYNGISYATVQLWLKTDVVNNSYNYGAFAWNNSNNNGGITIGISPLSKLYICYRDNAWSSGSYPQIHSLTSVNDGEWHHVIFVYDSVGAKLYIDGTLENAITRNSQLSDISNELIYIGHLANHPVGNYHFEGAIDEVAIWDRGLEASEVQALYAIPETMNIIGLLIGVFIILIKKK